MKKLDKVLSIDDLRILAQRRLPAGIFGYVDGGAEDQETVRLNRQGFANWAFVPHILTDVSKRSLAASLFGRTYSIPVGISPMGVSGLCWYEGDLALARAAAQVNVPAVLSAASSISLEEVARANPDIWYQAYLPADLAVIRPLLKRVQNAGIRVLVVTVDVPIASTRENELRNGFSIPLRPGWRLACSGLVRPAWLANTFYRTLMHRGIPHFENFTAERGGPIIAAPKKDHRAGRAAMSWNEIRQIRDLWPGKLIIKGVLRPQDAKQAQLVGADAIVVSNHGGRQLDGSMAAIDALPAVVAAVDDMTIIIDSGFRRGTDVLKALCLGANFVMVGRPAMYGLAAAGTAGASRAFELLRKEIDINLALLGARKIEDLNPDYLVRAGLQQAKAI